MTAETHALVGAYALAAVDDVERARVEQHLRSCASCAEEVAGLRAAAARLGAAAAVEPPPQLRERVLKEVAKTSQLPPGPTVSPPEEGPAVKRWRRFAAAGVAAGILAAGAATVTYAVEEQRVRTAQAVAAVERDRARQVASVLAAPDAVIRSASASGGGRVTVVASASRNAAVVTGERMPAVGAGRTYQLWLVSEAGIRSAGLVARTDTSTLVAGLHNASKLAVSVERAGGVPQPTRPVAFVPLS